MGQRFLSLGIANGGEARVATNWHQRPRWRGKCLECWLRKSGCRLVGKQPKNEKMPLGKFESLAAIVTTMEVGAVSNRRSRCGESIWVVSLAGGVLLAAKTRNNKQNIVASGNFGGSDCGDGYELTIGYEVVTMVPVW